MRTWLICGAMLVSATASLLIYAVIVTAGHGSDSRWD